MSYLDVPRMNFFGYFQADVSTINNTTSNFNNDTFKQEYQQIGTDQGGWNPEGTGSFRLIDCKISGGRLGKRQLLTPQDDPAIGMVLDNANQRVSGKLVDLDPEQQGVSQIWGMQVRLADAASSTVFSGDYQTAAFINLWKRQQRISAPDDQQLAAVYQSVLRQVDWRGAHDSALLRALRESSDDGCLSINMNVYGYGRDPSIPRYTLGHVVGSIGPYRRGAPKHFVVGRQMANPLQNPTAPPQGVYDFTCVVDQANRSLSADFGNCLQIKNADGGFEDVGQLLLALDKSNATSVLDTVAAADVEILGEVDYRRGQPPALQDEWYHATAGIVDLDYGAAGPWAAEHIADRPLLLLTPAPVVPGAAPAYQVVVQESINGLYARSDDFVCRLDPDQTVHVDFHVSRFGKPHAARLLLVQTAGMLGGGDPTDPPINVGFQPTYPWHVDSGPDGKALLPIRAPAQGAGNPRGYLDGQLYGIGYVIAGQPSNVPSNPWNFISVLAFDHIEIPEHPSWYADIQPIFKQYANLYPIMSRHLIELGDYESVIPHVRILDMAFSLPRSDPNHMPVTRDLSDAKRDMILRWLREPGADGLPLKGVAPPAKTVLRAAPAPAAALSAQPALEPLQTAGKTSYLMNRIAALGSKP